MNHTRDYIILKDILCSFEIIDRFEDIQLVDCRTGEYLSTVDYLDDSGFYKTIENYLDRPVICIRPKMSQDDKQLLYLEIRLGTEQERFI